MDDKIRLLKRLNDVGVINKIENCSRENNRIKTKMLNLDEVANLKILR